MITWVSTKGVFYKSNSKEFNESFNKATTAFPTAQGKGDYYQDNGFFSSTFSCTFSFTTLDESEEFKSALLETGNSKIIEPTSYIIKNVQVLSISKTKGFVQDVLRYKYVVSFGESLNEKELETTENYINQSLLKSDEAESLTAESFEDQLDLDSINDQIQQKSNFENALIKIQDVLGTTVTSIASEDFLKDPHFAIIAFMQVIGAPKAVYASVVERINMYSVLLDTILNVDHNYNLAQTDSMRSNNAVYAQSFGSMVINAMIMNAISLPYENKLELASISNIIKVSYESYRDYLDGLEDQGDFKQNGTIQQTISELVYNTIGYLYKISFSLKNEYIFETEDDLTTPFDVAKEYYLDNLKNDEESTLDFVEKSNDFDSVSGLFFPRGYSIKVYI